MNNAQAKRILVIADDPHTLAQIQSTFAATELRVVVVASAEEAPRQIYQEQPHLILCDLDSIRKFLGPTKLAREPSWTHNQFSDEPLEMSTLSEGQLIAFLQDLTDAPIIWLSSSDSPQDLARGLDAGAIDYIVKPLAAPTLLARVRAAFRHHATSQPAQGSLQDEPLKLDPHSQRVFLAGAEVKLTRLERRLLFFLFDHADEICTFEQILEQVWGWEFRGSNQYVHIYMSRLRHKLEADPQQPIYLLSEHGVGYQFRRTS